MISINESSPLPSTANGDIKNQIDTGSVDVAHRQPKEISNQVAKLALAGHIVHQGKDGDFYVCKYGQSRYCQNFAELHAFARQLGVTHHG